MTTRPFLEVLAAARDFSERRADLWPDVHVAHLKVHEVGETSAGARRSVLRTRFERLGPAAEPAIVT